MKDDLIEQCARAAYDATPFRSTEGPYEAQTEEYRRMCRLIANAVLAIARPAILEEAATTGYRVCAETRHVTLGDKVVNAIRALATTGQEGGR